MPGLRSVTPADLPRLLYQKVGLFRTIVDQPADDIWDKGWDVVTENDALKERLEQLDRQARIKQAFKRATRLARRDGKAFVRHHLVDNTGDSTMAPSGVRSCLPSKAIPLKLLDHCDYDDEGNVIAYWFKRKDRKGQPLPPLQVHHERVDVVIQHPDEEDDEEGISVLSWMITDAQGHENIKWGAAETFFRYGAPLYWVHIPAEVDEFDPSPDSDDVKALEAKLAALRNNTTQKAWFKGAKIEALSSSQKMNSPEPYHEMFMESIAGGARIPKRELTGSEAGALASAGWDEKRYFNRVGNDQEDFGAPLVMGWYRHLESWGLVQGIDTQIRFIQWFPHLELSETETSEVIEAMSRAAVNYARVGMPLPVEATKLLTWPKDVDPNEPLQLQGGIGARRLDARRKQDLRIEASAELRALEERFGRELSKVYQDWFEVASSSLDSYLDAHKSKAWKRGRLDVAHDFFTFNFFPGELEAVWLSFLIDAGDLGMLKTWQDIGADGELRPFLDTLQGERIAQFAQTYSAKKAKEETDKMRDKIAEVLADPDRGSVADIRKALREEFGRLDNEITIARTESMRGFNRGSQAAMYEAGLDEWEFQDFDGSCPVCIPLDGRRFPLSDETYLPPEGTHPNCRCTNVPVIPGVDL